MAADDYEALYAKARKALQQRKLLKAIDLFEEAIGVNPDDADAHDGLATACYLAQDYRTAASAFTRVTQLRPRDARAYVNLGAICNLQKDYAAAGEWLRKGIQRDGRNLDCYYNLGIAQKNLGNIPLAVSAYRECLRLDPRMIDAHINLANLYVDQNNLAKAIEHYTSALAIDPGFDRARRGLESVQQRRLKQRETANPFGRLVDERGLVERDAVVTAMTRQMSVDERFEDRQKLQLATAESIGLAEQLLSLLTDRLEPALLQASRAVAEGGSNRTRLLESRDDVQRGSRKVDKLFAKWQAQYHQIRAHEISMQPVAPEQ